MKKLFFVVLLVCVFLFAGTGMALASVGCDKHKAKLPHKCVCKKDCSVGVCNYLDNTAIVIIEDMNGSAVAVAHILAGECTLTKMPQFGKGVWVSENVRLPAGNYTLIAKKVVEYEYKEVMREKFTITNDMVGCKKKKKVIYLEITE